MTTRFGGQNVVDPIRRVLVKRPDAAFAVQDPKRWHYTSRPDLAAAQEEHDALVEILRQAGAEILRNLDPTKQYFLAPGLSGPEILLGETPVRLREVTLPLRSANEPVPLT